MRCADSENLSIVGQGVGEGSPRDNCVCPERVGADPNSFFGNFRTPPPPSMTPPLDVCLYDNNLDYEFYCTRGGWMRSISHDSEFQICFFFFSLILSFC